MIAHEVKRSPDHEEETEIAPAFGNLRCPKLVGQVKGTKLRVKALWVLCDEMKNPMSVVGCVEAGVVPVLNEQSYCDADANVRERASKALSICARDANGCTAMLDSKTPEAVAPALNDDDAVVRRNIYEALVGISNGNRRGVRALVDANYPKVLVGKAAKESSDLKPLALQLLRHCLSDDRGLHQALEASAVETSIALLAAQETPVRTAAADTLTTLCFAEMAKVIAIEQSAVPALVTLLKDTDAKVRAAAAGALMAVTTTDEGKRAMVPEGADPIESVALLVDLLHQPDSGSLAPNCLKCIANIAVHPRARAQLKDSQDCLNILDDLCASSSALVAKHANIAKNAVLWEP